MKNNDTQNIKSKPRKLGIFKEKIKIPKDFDKPMPEEWFNK